MSLRHPEIVGFVQEQIHSIWLVLRAVSPRTDLRETSSRGVVRLQEEGFPLLGPVAQVVLTGEEFVIDLANAEDFPCRVLVVEPIPVARTEIEAVVLVLGSDEGVRVEQVDRHVTPSRSANS